MQAEKQAYALARYSRSGDPVEASVAWVDTHSEERFWESFYFDYGHASIADLGHVAVCLEEISELAAIEVLDEQLWDGQARSTRYQDFATKTCVVPPELQRHDLEPEYRAVVGSLLSSYAEVHAQCITWIAGRNPRPDEMNPKSYERNIAARAFDMARYFLPLGIPTSVGQVVSIRSLEKQISRLLVSDLEEVRNLGKMLTEGCRTIPPGAAQAPAPTLARHARPATWQREVRARAQTVARTLFTERRLAKAAGTVLATRAGVPSELLATLIYEDSCLPWNVLVARIEALDDSVRAGHIKEILGDRGRFDELPRAARAGHAIAFEIVMDIGGWRDMHRHRRCHQHLQELDPGGGFELPPDAVEAGIAARCESEHAKAVELSRRLRDEFGPRVAAYPLPLMHRVRSLFKMDFAEADYIARLRSGVKGHPSYRRVAWDMYRALCEAEPSLACLLDATSPDVQDPLTR